MTVTDIKNYIAPGIMPAQIWPESIRYNGATLHDIIALHNQGFYECFQMRDVPFKEERLAIAQMVRQTNISITYSVARRMNEMKLNPSSLDINERQRAIKIMTQCIDEASEAGAAYYQILSGPSPLDSHLRSEALKHLADSMIKLCEYAQKSSTMTIIIEPLDVFAHKKGTLGYIHETIELFSQIRSMYSNFSLCIDTSHSYLNNEDPVQSMQQCMNWVDEFHICNCVNTPGHPLYGDLHIPFGEPGVLSKDKITELLFGLYQCHYISAQKRARIFFEVTVPQDEKHPELIPQHLQQLIIESWNIINERIIECKL